METMTNELTIIPRTIGMMGGMGMLKPEFIEDALYKKTTNLFFCFFIKL